MKIKMNLFLGFMFFFVLANVCPLFSQEQAATEQPTAQQAPAAKPAASEVLSEPEVQWIWGDVVSVDAAAKKVQVKYLDYETDTEKEISIETDAKTTYENANSLEEIKAQDTLSIDYMMNADGKNIAKNISVEKPESAQAVPQDVPQDAPKEEPKAAAPDAQ
jgi:hypothetical protein